MTRVKYSKSAKICLLFLFCLIISNCSSDQQQSDQQEVQTDQEGENDFNNNENNFGDNDQQSENNQQFDNDQQGFGQNDNSQGENQFGEGVNNDQSNEFADNQGQFEQQTANGNINQFANGAFGNNQAPAQQEFASNNAFPNADNVQIPDQPLNNGGAAPLDTPQMAVSGENGRVYYISSEGSQVYRQAGSDPVKQLEQGDHPLIYQENEWGKTSEGYFVPMSELSVAPIGRRKSEAIWR